MGIQTKDIDKVTVLKFLKNNKGTWCTLHNGFKHSVGNAMPEGLPIKLRLSVMRNLINRGLVDGCPCGCRGDFEITQKGLEYLKENVK